VRTPKAIHEIYGHAAAKRALEVALSGDHSILLYGPRRCGKTTLIEAFSVGKEMDSCACGNYASVTAECSCNATSLRRWMRRFLREAPRYDIVIEVLPVPVKEMRQPRPQPDDQMGLRISNARLFAALSKPTTLDDAGERTLEMCVRRLSLSVGQHDAILRVARTIANLDSSPRVAAKHVAEACQYQSLAAMHARDWLPFLVGGEV
jgi:magnesium chelatase family protein